MKPIVAMITIVIAIIGNLSTLSFGELIRCAGLRRADGIYRSLLVSSSGGNCSVTTSASYCSATEVKCKKSPGGGCVDDEWSDSCNSEQGLDILDESNGNVKTEVKACSGKKDSGTCLEDPVTLDCYKGAGAIPAPPCGDKVVSGICI